MAILFFFAFRERNKIAILKVFFDVGFYGLTRKTARVQHDWDYGPTLHRGSDDFSETTPGLKVPSISIGDAVV